MPSNARSLAITEQYRKRLMALARGAEGVSQAAWRNVDLADFEQSYGTWLGTTTGAVARAQRQGVRLSLGYTAAFLTSELGRRVRTPQLDATTYVGFSRDGRSLAEAYDSPRIGVLVALKEGKPNPEALDAGWLRAKRAIDLDTLHAPRQATLDVINQDERFDGWQRAVRGTCAACADTAGNTYSGEVRFEVHPGCQCVSEPVVKNARDRFPRLTGAEIFAAKSKDEQDQMLGPEAAQAVRDGLPLHKLVKHEPMENEQSWITQRPLGEITDHGPLGAGYSDRRING